MRENDNAREAELLIAEIEEDAFDKDGPGLTLDQRIAIASIRASLASVAALRAQTEMQARASVAAERMTALMEQATDPTAPAHRHDREATAEEAEK